MNCWYTIATRRFCTGTAVTSWPSNRISPAVGRNKPAISRIKLVFPASVGPSRMLKPLAASSSRVG